MSRTDCCFGKTSLSWKKSTSRRSSRNLHGRSCKFRLPWLSQLSPIEFLKDVADKVTKAICLRSVRKSSNRVSSSMRRSKPIGVSVDYYRTEAVEDCIEFIHSSFSRSNSVTATPGKEFPHTFLRNFES
ncbi:josephin protein [Spatholobus suberectus]|nr:josephin protein [Spatholobus suberectus]